MKLSKSRKSSVGLLMLPTMGFAVAVILFFFFSAPTIDDYIGGKQAAVLKSVGQGEQYLSSVDVAARFAAWQSIFDLGDNGGFYSEKLGDLVPTQGVFPCDQYVYKLWNAKDETCWPNYYESYKSYFNRDFKFNFLPQLDTAFQSINYDYTIGQGYGGKILLAGVADKTLPLEIDYTHLTAKPVSIKTTPAPASTKTEFISSDYGYLSWPVAIKLHQINSGFGARECKPEEKCSPNHAGVDIYAPMDTDVLAAADGVVKLVNNYACWGLITINHGNGLMTLYAHLDTISVTDGQTVTRGQVIGQSGDRGDPKNNGECIRNAYNAPHLHFSVSYSPVTQNLKYGNQLAVMNDFQLGNNFVQPLCFFERNSYVLDKVNAKNNNFPINQELDSVCQVYNFPEQFTKTREEAIPKSDGQPKIIDSAEIAKEAEDKNKGAAAPAANTDLKFVKKPVYDKVMEYGDLIASASQEFNVPKAKIAATIAHESGGYPEAISPEEPVCESALGLGQFRYDTALGYKDIFGDGLTRCGCGCGGTYPVNAPVGCKKSSTCPPTDPRFIPERMIRAIAKYHQILSKHYDLYNDVDAFDFLAYYQGLGLVDKSIENAKVTKPTSDNNPSWGDVVDNFVQCNWVKVGQYYQCPTYRAADAGTKAMLRKYVDEMLMIKADFGGGSYSSGVSYRNVISPGGQTAGATNVATTTTTKEEIKKIGYYHILPSFTTSIDYDLSAFESIRKWADYTYRQCYTQKDMKQCVEEYKTAMNAYASNPGQPDVKYAELTSINPVFQFKEPFTCDGDKDGFYDFIESFEKCYEFGSESCYCNIKSDVNIGINTITMTGSSISWQPKSSDTSSAETYDLPENRHIKLKNNDDEVDSFVITKQVTARDDPIAKIFTGTAFSIQSVKNNALSLAVLSKNIYFIKKGDVLQRIDDRDVAALQNKGVLECSSSAQHKFRFCAQSPDLIPTYDKNAKTISDQPVNIRFAIDFQRPIPPPITSDSEIIADVSQKQLEDAKNLPVNQKCQGLGTANLKLKVTTSNLVSSFDSFVSSLAVKLVPQLSILLFAKNFLVQKESLPALVTVSLDLNGASKDCDIAGIVYKCGIGPAPYKENKEGKSVFDFSNPTGYVDISPRFNSNSGFTALPPNACVAFKNPDASSTPKNIDYMKPAINGDSVSFSISKCADPITQFKKAKGVDLIVSALQGFNYYFAFSYVNSAKEYGEATVIRTQEIPSMLSQLEADLGLGNLFILNDLLNGNYESLLGRLGMADELSMIRSAIASASLDRLLANVKGEVFNGAFAQLANTIKDEDAQKIFSQLASDAADGKFDSDYSWIIVNKAQDMIPGKVNEFFDNIDYDKIRNGYDYVRNLPNLPLEKERELLARYYTEKAKATGLADSEISNLKRKADNVKNMGEQEVRKEIAKATQTKEDVALFLKSLDPAYKIELAKQMMRDSPQAALSALDKALDGDSKVQLVKSVLQDASGALNEANSIQNNLARLIAQATPDYAKKEALDWVTSQPGYETYKDVLNIFSDFENTCQ